MADDKQQQQILMQNIQRMFSNNNVSVPQEQPWIKKAKKSGLSKHDLELAVAVLLVDLASCDQHFDPVEYEVIVGGLRRLFGTQRHDVKSLVNEAVSMLSGMRGPQRFGDQLRENLPLEQRQIVMEIIEECIAADGQEDGYETYMRHRLNEMLGLKQ